MSDTELWARDDGWKITLTRLADGLCNVTRLPMIVPSVPNPLTYEYAVSAMKPHGYERVHPNE